MHNNAGLVYLLRRGSLWREFTHNVIDHHLQVIQPAAFAHAAQIGKFLLGVCSVLGIVSQIVHQRGDLPHHYPANPGKHNSCDHHDQQDREGTA